MGYSLTLKTMYKITNAQEPVSKDARTTEQAEIDCANYLIKSGIPRLVRQGRRALIRIRIRRLKAEELDELGAYLLANRRTWFIKQIEEKRNNEKSTPLS